MITSFPGVPLITPEPVIVAFLRKQVGPLSPLALVAPRRATTPTPSSTTMSVRRITLPLVPIAVLA
jgi:hypothetical protein